MSDDLKSEHIVVSESDQLGSSANAGKLPVLVFQGSHEELEVVLATLVASGVPAFLNVDPNDPVLGTTDRGTDGESTIGIYVSPSNVEAARAIIDAPEPTEEDLASEAALDTKTLEQAEAEIRRER